MRRPRVQGNGDQRPRMKELVGERLKASKVIRVFSIADFRYYWIGAFVSFSGSWIQRIAEGYFVFQMTHNEAQLAFVSFCSSIPVFFLGFVAGSFSDIFDKRRVLVVTQAIYAAGAIYLAGATYWHFVTYFQIVFVALLLGVVSTIEMPTRQSLVSRVVPASELATAIPLTATTFNMARIVGPALGSALLASFGVAACYLANGISFLALIWTALAIKADLTNAPREKQPVRDLIFEGARFTMIEIRLRTLFILESITGVFGIFYLGLLPAYTGETLGLDRISEKAAKAGLGLATTFVGIGAIIGLIIITTLSESPRRGLLIRLSMTFMGLSLLALAYIREPWLAYPVLMITGMCSIVQFNTTNALFQLLSPDERRGRVLAMHIWSLNGLSPFGILLFGWIASASHSWPHTKLGHLGPFRAPTDVGGAALAMLLGGIVMVAGAIAAWLSRKGLANLAPDLLIRDA
jgi:MFS family permease